MGGALTFVCDRCGALGRAAGTGRVRCGACGRVVVVEDPYAPAMYDAPGPEAAPSGPDGLDPSPPGAEATAVAAGARLPPLEPPSGPDRFERSEISPEDLPPPEGGYEDLVLDDDEVPVSAAPPAAGPVQAEVRPVEATARPMEPPRRAGEARARPPDGRAAPREGPTLPYPFPVAPGERARRIPRLAAAAVLFGAGAALAAGVTVAARAVLREPAIPAPVDPAPAPAVEPAAVEVPAQAEPPLGVVVAPAEDPPAPSVPAQPEPRRREGRSAAKAAVSISARPLVPAPHPVAGAGTEQAAPRDEPLELETHGLSAPRPIEVASALPPPRPAVEDAPAYPGTGFRKPAPADRSCLERALRLPRDVAGRFDGTLTVKFPVAADGTVGPVEVLGPVPDPRVPRAVETAIRSCRFLPGTDPRGRPTALWAVMPLRFVAR